MINFDVVAKRELYTGSGAKFYLVPDATVIDWFTRKCVIQPQLVSWPL